MGAAARRARLIRTALAAVGLACAGCSSPQIQCQIFPRGFDAFLIPGQRAELQVGISEFCLNASQLIHVADEVTVEVFDPDHQPWPFLASAPIRSSGQMSFENVAIVSFTPDRAGSWRINAKFEPGIGQTQQVIEAIELRSDAGVQVLTVAGFPRDCEDYGLTELGTALCATVSSGPGIVTHRGQRLPGDAFALEKNTLFRALTGLEGLSIERLVDDAGFFETTHRIDKLTNTDNSPKIASAGEDFWLLANDRGTPYLLRGHPEADGGFSTERRPAPDFFVEGIAAGADGVLAFGSSGFNSTASRRRLDGGSQTLTIATTGSLLGVDETTLWQFGSSGLAAVRRSDLRSSTIPLPVMVPVLGMGLLAPGTPAIPRSVSEHGEVAFKPQHLIPRFDGTDIRLEGYVVGAEYFSTTSATRTHAFARSKDSKTLKIFERPAQ